MSIATLPPAPSTGAIDLPAPFLEWFRSKGWQPRAHQLELLALAEAGKSALLIAPTGAGKTLAGFLPALTDLARRGKPKPGTRKPGVHTLYISPLKALAVDIHRNLSTPVDEMGLPVTIETRTGDTPQSKRQRQKLNPPDILLTTPEQLALLLSHKDAEIFFADLRHVVLDELHSLVTSKRGHMLALGLARLHRLCPGLKAIGLSATVADPDMLRGWLVPQSGGDELADIVTVAGGAKPDIAILESGERVPWSGHSARYSMPEVYEAIRRHKTTLLFVNTRSQSELLFQELWKINEDNLPIALHHGSLDVSQRRKVEQAMQTVVARGGVYLDARSGHRLGRCRSGHPCRCAQGRKQARPAHRPRQPPARRTLACGAGALQPFRGYGMPAQRVDCQLCSKVRRIPRRSVGRRDWMCCVSISSCVRGRRRTVRSRCIVCRDQHRRHPTRRLDARTHSTGRCDFVAHRWLRAARLRPAMPASVETQPTARWRMSRIRRIAQHLSPECRYHRRSEPMLNIRLVKAAAQDRAAAWWACGSARSKSGSSANRWSLATLLFSAVMVLQPRRHPRDRLSYVSEIL